MPELQGALLVHLFEPRSQIRHVSIGTFQFHSFQGSFFLENLHKPKENGSGFWKERWLKGMEKESTLD